MVFPFSSPKFPDIDRKRLRDFVWSKKVVSIREACEFCERVPSQNAFEMLKILGKECGFSLVKYGEFMDPLKDKKNMALLIEVYHFLYPAGKKRVGIRWVIASDDYYAGLKARMR